MLMKRFKKLNTIDMVRIVIYIMVIHIKIIQ